MSALRNVQRTLAPAGKLLELHAVPPSSRAESHGRVLGELDDRLYFEKARRAERALEHVVAEGLFTPEHEVETDVLERFDTAADLLEIVGERPEYAVPPELVPVLEAAEPPVDLRERVLLRLLVRG